MTLHSLHSAVIFATEELSTMGPTEGNVCYLGFLWAHSPAAPRGLYLVQKRCRRHKGWGCSALKGGGPLNKASLNRCLFHDLDSEIGEGSTHRDISKEFQDGAWLSVSKRVLFPALHAHHVIFTNACRPRVRLGFRVTGYRAWRGI